MKGVTPLCRDRVPLPPSCLEFVPNHPDYFIVGTYTLAEQDDTNKDDDNNEEAIEDNSINPQAQSRSGSLILYHLSSDSKSITTISTFTHPSAILDLHFCPHDPSYFSITSSTGTISILTIDWTLSPPSIRLHSSFQTFDEDIVVTSGVWHPLIPRLLALTTTAGSVTLVQFDENLTKQTVLSEEIYRHKTRFCDSEAWTVAFGATSKTSAGNDCTSLYSGGDDSLLRSYTFEYDGVQIKEGAYGAGGVRGINGHEAGVVAILPLPLDMEVGKEILLTGSYDEYIRVISMSNHHTASLAKDTQDIRAELRLGGGVWRLKFLTHSSDALDVAGATKRKWLVLVSCMHAGAKVIEIEGSLEGEWSMRILAEFDEHKSMNYASDVQTRQDDTIVCVSTSFYDKLLAVWRLDS